MRSSAKTAGEMEGGGEGWRRRGRRRRLQERRKRISQLGKKSEASPWLVFHFQLWASERLSYSRRHVENGPFWGEGEEGAIHAKSIPSSPHKIPQYPCLCSCALRLNYAPPEKRKKALLAPPVLTPSPSCIRRHPSIWPQRSHLGVVPGSPRWLPGPPLAPSLARETGRGKGT